MGSPVLWWYPDRTGPLQELDLVDISMIERESERFRTDEVGITGGISVTDYGMRHTFRLARERFAGGTQEGEDLVAASRGFENHIQRGGFFGFARDKDKAWGGFLDASYNQGGAVLATRGNVFEYNPLASLSAGDYVVIQSANPRGELVQARIASQTGNTITLASGLRKAFLGPSHPVVIHERDFFPMLRAPAGARPILSDDRRLNYTLDIECIEDVEGMFAFANFGGALTGVSSSSGARGKSVETALANIRNRNQHSSPTTLPRPGGS